MCSGRVFRVETKYQFTGTAPVPRNGPLEHPVISSQRVLEIDDDGRHVIAYREMQMNRILAGTPVVTSYTEDGLIAAKGELTIPIQKQLARIGLGPRRVVEATEEVVIP